MSAPTQVGVQATPQWILDAIARADARLAAVPADGQPSASDEGVNNSLLIAALTAAGLSQSQAECISNVLSTNPGLSGDLQAIATKVTESGQITDTTPAALGALAALSPERTTQVALALTPCLDATTIAALAAGGAATVANVDPAAILTALTSTGASATSALQGAAPADVLAVMQQVVTSLPPDQAAALLAAVGALLAGGSFDQASLANIDLSALNLSNLTPQQLAILIGALLALLPVGSLNQIGGLASVNPADLALNFDPQALDGPGLGALLLLLSPLFAATLKPIDTGPPAGQPADKIYLPPGTDLSAINPLYFLNTEDLVNGGLKEGIPAPLTICALQALRSLSPTALGELFTNSTNNLASIGQIVLGLFSCL